MRRFTGQYADNGKAVRKAARSSIGIEINPEYAELIRQRMSQVTPLLKLA